MKNTQKWKSQFMIVASDRQFQCWEVMVFSLPLIWWLAEKTSSPLILGISGLVAYLPMTLFSPLAGIAADRYNRNSSLFFRIWQWVQLHWFMQGCCSFLTFQCGRYLSCCVSWGLGSTFQQPAIQSIIPQLVPKDQLVKTNGWMQLLNSGSFLLGPVIGASLYAVFPMSVVLISDVVGAVWQVLHWLLLKFPNLKKQIWKNSISLPK